MKKFDLEIIVFFCGAVVMAYEIIGSRMLGPYVGTSMMVWSSIIGIILLSLSLGYYFGGRIADAYPDPRRLGIIVGVAAIFIFLSIYFKDPLASGLLKVSDNLYFTTLLLSLLLFCIPAIALGMVSPFAARLKLRNLRTSGATVGHLYALSTVGSITGTFLAGFYLIPTYWLSDILLILAVALIVIAVYLLFQNKESYASTSTNEVPQNSG